MKKRLVQVWDKITTQRVKFKSGTVYERTETGAIVRLSPLRPWRGKSERRQVIKMRRVNKELAMGS